MSKLKEREKELSPNRFSYAKTKLPEFVDIIEETDTSLVFIWHGCRVTIYPYTGWFTGQTVKDGRGIHNLIKQLKP